MYDRILLPTDGSDGTQSAIDHAIELAEYTGATLHILYVVDTSVAAAVPEAQTYTISEIFEEAGSQVLDAVRDQATERGVPVETAIRHGSAHTEILAAADESNAEIIVMGTHGRTGINRMLLGSVADRVIRHASQPVLVKRTVE